MATNKHIVRAIEEAWDRNDTAALDGHFSPDFDNAHSGAPGLPVGLAGAKMAHGGAMVSFPDRRVQILDLIGEGDRVFVRTRITGTNSGGAAFLGAPEANGAKIDFEMWGVYQLRDGKVVAHWGLNDGVTAMMQVGSLKPSMWRGEGSATGAAALPDHPGRESPRHGVVPPADVSNRRAG